MNKKAEAQEAKIGLRALVFVISSTFDICQSSFPPFPLILTQFADFLYPVEFYRLPKITIGGQLAESAPARPLASQARPSTHSLLGGR
jgi:hypothetical protein